VGGRPGPKCSLLALKNPSTVRQPTDTLSPKGPQGGEGTLFMVSGCPSADAWRTASESIARKGCAGWGRSAVGPATVPARESAMGRSHFCYPPVFLHFPAFISNPLAPGPNLIPGGAAAPLSWGWGRAAPPLGSHPESLIEGGVASMILMKRNDIPALIVSTPGFGLAPCRGRCGIGLPLLAEIRGG
jgi:hypothetical protein